MHSFYQIFCLLALIIAVQAKTHSNGLGYGMAPKPDQMPLKDQSPAGGPDGMQKPEPPRENIVDHIAKACPGLQPQVDRLKEEIAHPNQFCRFYLSARRLRSPIADMNADQVMKGCVCLLRQEGMGITESSSQAPQTFVPAQTSSGSVDPTDCIPEFEDIIKAEYTVYKQFCKFFGTSLRRVSPIPGLSAEQVMQGCKCILENKAKTPIQTGSRLPRNHSAVTKAPQPAKASPSAAAVTTAIIISKTVIVSTE